LTFRFDIKVAYHTFNLGCYFTPIFGALIADMWLGKFKTIFFISLIYVLGQVINTITAIPTLGIPAV
jgi:dipeptide/tripeptide permease